MGWLLNGQRELLRLRRRDELQPPPVRDLQLPRETPDLLAHRLRLGGAEVGPAGVQLLVMRQELGPILGQMLQEVLARAGPQEEEVRPDAGRARLAWRLDDLAELFGPVGDTGED